MGYCQTQGDGGAARLSMKLELGLRKHSGKLSGAPCQPVECYIQPMLYLDSRRLYRSSPNYCRQSCFRGRLGGVEKRGGRKTSRMTPLPKRGFGPPSYGTFSTPLECRCSVFPVQKSTAEQTRSSFGGVQNFSGGRVLWYVFLPPYVLHPPISWPNCYSLENLSATGRPSCPRPSSTR